MGGGPDAAATQLVSALVKTYGFNYTDPACLRARPRFGPPETTELYGRASDAITLDEIERITSYVSPVDNPTPRIQQPFCVIA